MEEPDRCLLNCDQFGRHAIYFESKIVPLWQDVYDTLASRAKVSRGSTVLDVGCGTGEVAVRVARLVGARGKVVAMDLERAMLTIAMKKSEARGLRNIEFLETSMEAMDLPDSAFDSVLGNYSLCCSFDYEAALAECLRVMKPGGNLTYNHAGPDDPVQSQTIYDLFDEYKTRKPSKRLRQLRASDDAQMEAVDRFRDPDVALTAMKEVGFHRAKASLHPRRIRYPDAAAYVDRMLDFDWRSEVEEMDPADVREFRREAIRELSPLGKPPGFTIEDKTLYFDAMKAAR